MGASFVKSCFVGDSSADLAAHREARRRYERQTQLLAQEASELTPGARGAMSGRASIARDCRRSNLLSASSFGSDKSLVDLPTPRQHQLYQPHHYPPPPQPIPAPQPSKALKKKSQTERAFELPRTAVRLQQLHASSRQYDQPEDEMSPVPSARRRDQEDWTPRKPKLSAAALAKHAIAASLSPSDAGTLTASECSFGDDYSHLYASPPHFQSPPAARSNASPSADPRSRSPASNSFRALLPEVMLYSSRVTLIRVLEKRID